MQLLSMVPDDDEAEICEREDAPAPMGPDERAPIHVHIGHPLRGASP